MKVKSTREEEGKDDGPEGSVRTGKDDLPNTSLMEHHNVFVIFNTFDSILTPNS
jgi:hypothetical protein